MHAMAIGAVFFSSNPAAAQDTTPVWKLVEELRIGSVSGEVAFSRVTSLTVSANGEWLYVAQRQDNAIWMFEASSGERIRKIGRSGDGPGEFRYLSDLGWRADTLYATDFLLDRIAMFSAAGEHLRTTQNGATFIGRPSHPIGLTAAGYAVGQARLPSRMLASGEVTSSPWSLVDGEGKLVRNVASRDLRETSGAAPIGSAVIHFVQPLSKRTYLAMAPDGTEIVVVSQPAGRDPPGSYQVMRFGADGTEMSTRDYRYTPREIPARFADSVYTTVASSLEQLVPRGRAMEAARKYWNIPTYYPPVSGLVVSSTGDAWLRRKELNSSTVAWFVLDREGRIKASVIAPAKLRIHFVNDSSVWGTIKGELDVEYVVRYRIDH